MRENMHQTLMSNLMLMCNKQIMLNRALTNSQFYELIWTLKSHIHTLLQFLKQALILNNCKVVPPHPPLPHLNYIIQHSSSQS